MRKGLFLTFLIVLFSVKTMALELKFAHQIPSNEPIHETLVEFGKDLEKKSNGYFKVQVYPNAELGNNKDNVEYLRRGANIVSVTDAAYLADYVPTYGPMNGPFLFNDWKDIVRLSTSRWGKEQMDKCYALGIKVLCMDWYFGNRYLFSNKAVKTTADMRGLKIRIPPNKLWSDIISAMGGSPTIIQLPELYSALSQGVVDGGEAPLSTLYGLKVQEVRKYVSETKHITTHQGIIMSAKLWESIPPEYQKLLQDEINRWGIVASERVADLEANHWRKLMEEAGMEFVPVDSEDFIKACKSVYNNPGWLSFDELRKIIDDTPFPTYN